ncbi:phenol degradation protein meta [Burkholderia cenocepacia]|uniref:SphA family protein n=1 Tax=Burkholderia cenocepacia TaxID=95486 RepID=UPI000CFF180C|nr:transporter [Burkholderia cenocepacia]PRF95452.1 phenol degradation protein meta [Burkholderia cenocepacia]
MKHFIFLGIFLWALSRGAMGAQGVTYGGPVGGTDIQNAYLPPEPGLYGSFIFVGAYGDKFYDNSGRSPATSVRLPGEIAEFGLLYVYPVKLFGGTLGSSVATGYGWGSITVNGRRQNFNGINDIYTDVLMWSKHLGSFDAGMPRGLTVKLGYSMVIPIGKYNTTDLYTTGQNTYYYIPNAAFTYLTGPNFLGDGIEFSAHFFLDVARKNFATNYKNGLVADVDVAISEVIGRWQVGVAGYYARQFTDDSVNGQPVPGGNRFASAAVGPVVERPHVSEDTRTLLK